MTEAVTPFRQRVYDALCRVPRGRVTTYKLLGEAIGCASSRAIGQALRNNPFAPEVPCHRVIRTDLTETKIHFKLEIVLIPYTIFLVNFKASERLIILM